MVVDMALTTTIPVSNQIVEFMSASSAYRDRPATVQVLETHISWVFLTDRYAYKLKKPVRFEFVDFTTPELRHRACLEELRLNRRLAPGVYLSVIPVTRRSDGVFVLGGEGEEVDWVVQMRRLPAALALDNIIRRGQLLPEDVRAVTQHLVQFYSGQTPQSLFASDYRDALRRRIEANRDTLWETMPAREHVRVARIIGAQLRYLSLQTNLFDDRVASGCIVEGHGDLRPEHIYLEKPPVIIDSIEFSLELRQVDIADELSFLALECRRLGDGGLGQQVLAEYQETCRDPIPDMLLAFYCSYRACVRAKVAALRAEQAPIAARRPLLRLIHQYIDWADHSAAQLGEPSLIVVGGMMGTGKSTLASALAEVFGAELLSTDRIRRSLLGASESPAGFAQDNYEPAQRARIYDELFRCACVALDQGRSAILDGTFLGQVLRERAYELARRHGAVPLCVWCDCPRHVALSRIRQRATSGRGDSEARADLYDLQARDLEPMKEGDPAINVDTALDMSSQLQAVCNELKDCLFG
jgi:aminoglycoside phosphotransferase family enzyme/predicted kinase